MSNARSVVALSAGLLGLVAPLPAQDAPAPDSVDAPGSVDAPASGAVWFPGDFAVAPLLANPLEVRLGGALISTERDVDDSFAGRDLEAQVAVGVRIPVVRLRDEGKGGPALELGFELGVFSRFFMRSIEKEQIGTDYRVGVPLGIRSGIVDVRLTLLHVSSHFGDDYLDDNPQTVFQSSREGIELLLGVRPAAGLRVYAGGDLNLGRSEDFTGTGESDDPFVIFTTVEQWAVRFGAEWDPVRRGDRSVAPYAAANFETTELTERLASTVVAGLHFRVEGVGLRLGAEYHDGPSSMGQFRTVDERWVGVGLTVEL